MAQLRGPAARRAAAAVCKVSRKAITELQTTPYGEQRLCDETKHLAAMESEAKSRHARGCQAR